jgi:hypothetical protein
MEATLWVLLVVVGFGLLRAIEHVHVNLMGAVMERVAAAAFVGAGVIGASGWIGSGIAWVVGAVNSLGSSLGAAAVGSGPIWIAWLALSVLWVLALLPDSWFGWHLPPWLSVTGLVLPALAASIPGQLGDLLRMVIDGIGRLMVTAVSSAVLG